jgi:hypothetical protein
MSNALKKFSLKYQYLKLELEEAEEQAEEYNIKWNSLFGKYFVDKNSEMWVNEETGEIRKDNPNSKPKKKTPPPRSKIRKLYKKLSTFVHPDKGGSVEEFNSLKEAYEKVDLIELLNFAGQFGVEYIIDEEDQILLDKVCNQLEKDHNNITNSLAYTFFTKSKKHKLAVIQMLEQQYNIKIDQEDIPEELLES